MPRARRAVRIPQRPTLTYERRLWEAGHDVVAGVDEAGRGAWAGPLVAAAVALPRSSRERARLTRQLNSLGLLVQDSKLISRQARDDIARLFREHHMPCAVAEIPPAWIDRVGLGAANRLALAYALSSVVPRATAGLIDAFHLGPIGIEQHSLIHGDRRSVSIALASIVAKVHRDRWMTECDRRYPGYDFGSNVGYGTKRHRLGIARQGICPIHRRCFAPVAAVLGDD